LKEFDTSDPDIAFLKDAKGGHKVIPEVEALFPMLKDKVGFIFTDRPVFELKPIVEKNKVQAPAKVG
jgi:large subunit ribosomal protein LP0